MGEYSTTRVILKCTDPKCNFEWETTAILAGMAHPTVVPGYAGAQPIVYENDVCPSCRGKGRKKGVQ
jgi:hypothetical protein